MTVAGSARRMAETCKDIDLIATATDPAALATALIEHPLAAQSGSAGEAGARIVTFNGVSVDLRIVPPDAYGNLLQHFTGSAAHNIELRERAVKAGLSVSEHGIAAVEDGDVARYASEEEVYERLGLVLHRARAPGGQWRDRRRRPRASCRTWSRSATSAATCTATRRSRTAATRSSEMVEAARGRGYTYLAVTDHSASHGFGDHVTPEALWERIEEVAAYNGAAKRRFQLLAGSEVNIAHRRLARLRR